jgi:hypothetical protein
MNEVEANEKSTLTHERRATLAGLEFLSARDIRDRGGLTTDEKIALLREREQDVRELMVAEEENMGGDQARDQPLGDALGDIRAALASLGAERRAAAAPTKHG